MRLLLLARRNDIGVRPVTGAALLSDLAAGPGVDVDVGV